VHRQQTALPGALALVDPRLSKPPGVDDLEPLAQRWAVHRQQTAEMLSDAVIDALAARLRRHLRPDLPRDPIDIITLPSFDQP